MNLRKCLATGALTVAASIGAATFQSPPAPSTTIGATTVSIGATQENVLAALTADFVLEQRGTGGGSWLVYDKGDSPRRLVANLIFDRGRLRNVRRYWSPNNQTAAVPFASALFGALANLVSEGRRTCSLDVGTTQNPNAEIKTVFLDCGGKRIEVTLTQGRVGHFATVDEVIQSERQ